MKHVRPLGKSYTSLDAGHQLGRGLASEVAGKEGTVLPDELPKYFADSSEHQMRMLISVLDKVVQKRRRLSLMHETAYIDRGHLGKALWELLEQSPNFEATDQNVDAWRAKLHPYIESTEQEFGDPAKDPNFNKIVKLRDPGIQRSDFEGRWHEMFWETTGNTPRYEHIAAKIFDHVVKNELKLIRQREAEPPTKPLHDGGRLKRSSQIIASSAHDPRKIRSSKPKNYWIDFSEDAAAPNGDWETYCGTSDNGDIAEKLYRLTVDTLLSAWDGDVDFERCLPRREDFGRLLYSHFGSLEGLTKPETPERGRLWSLHFSVRKYYAKLAKSNRFRQLTSDIPKDGEVDRKVVEAAVSRVLPKDWIALRKQISGKEQNADISQLLRLGKLIIHSLDIPVDGLKNPRSSEAQREIDEQLNQLFEKRLDYFATSDGQSEIKRAEAFNRVWRNSISVSMQTLKNLMGNPTGEFDVGNEKSMRNALNVLASDISGLTERAKVVFGSKEIEFQGRKKSRSSIVASEDVSLTALEPLTLTIQSFRNKAFHFSTMRHVLGNIEKLGSVAGAKNAANSFVKLLSFDSELLSSAWEDEIEALKLREHLTLEQLKVIASETTRIQSATEVVVPKFRTLMKYAGHLAEADELPASDSLSRLASHNLTSNIAKKDLNDEDKQKFEENRARVGTLRLLYQRGFVNWLAANIDNPEILQTTLDTVRSRGLKRSKNFINERGLEAVIPSSRVEKLKLGNASSLAEVFTRMASECASAERLHRQYRPDRSKQKEVSNDVEKLRREVYLHLFTQYLRDVTGSNDETLESWIHDIKRSSEKVEDAIKIETPEMGSGSWVPIFYASLYLLPPDEASRLQHQFRKTAILEKIEKAHSRSATYLGNAAATEEAFAENRRDVLETLDRLMSLYIRVQAVGFSGEEVEHTSLSFTKKSKGKKTQELVCAAEEAYDLERLFDDDDDLHIKRTRRGLRLLKRFGQLDDIGPVLLKHPVKHSEFLRASMPTAIPIEQERVKKQREIITHLKTETKFRDDKAGLKKWSDDLSMYCDEYRNLATAERRNRFDMNGARFNDHFRAHEIYRRVWGRLTDFTGTWERDRICVFFGMLFQQSGGKLRLAAKPEMVSKAKKDDPEVWIDKLAISSEPANSVVTKNEMPQAFSFTGIWTDKGVLDENSLRFAIVVGNADALDRSKKELNTGVLTPPNAVLFKRYFLTSDKENELDVARREALEADGKYCQGSKHGRGPDQIRNDLAHFNALGRGRLTYLINAVRSLMAYDRKLKNSVAKSIIDLLAKEGLVLEWDIKDDRLRNPRVAPRVETHLGFARRKAFEKVFDLPQTSPRLTSMIQGLFSFNSEGHQPDRDMAGIEIEYPATFKATAGKGVRWSEFEYSGSDCT